MHVNVKASPNPCIFWLSIVSINQNGTTQTQNQTNSWWSVQHIQGLLGDQAEQYTPPNIRLYLNRFILGVLLGDIDWSGYTFWPWTPFRLYKGHKVYSLSIV